MAKLTRNQKKINKAIAQQERAKSIAEWCETLRQGLDSKPENIKQRLEDGWSVRNDSTYSHQSYCGAQESSQSSHRSLANQLRANIDSI